MDSLAAAVKSIHEANKELRKVITRGSDEVGQLEQFELKFSGTKEKFHQFKELISKNDSQAEELEALLNQDLIENRKIADSLRNQISNLKQSIGRQDTENEQLELKLKHNIEELHKLRHDRPMTYINSSSYVETNPAFIQRLRNDLEPK